MNRVFRKPGGHPLGHWVLELDGQEYRVNDVIREAGICRSAVALRMQKAASGMIAPADVLLKPQERRRQAWRAPKKGAASGMITPAEDLAIAVLSNFDSNQRLAFCERWAL